MPVNLPTTEQRTILVGRTGTGKTVAGLWHLSNYDFEMPWVLLDFKGDKHIKSIAKKQSIDFNFEFPKHANGLYHLRVLPTDTKGGKEASNLEKFLWKIYHYQQCGIYCDEGLMATNDAFDACLTQGRAMEIPMIICTQRPVWLSRFAFSEADYIQVFHLNDERDRTTVEGFTPLDSEDFKKLGKHESYYYDVSENELAKLKPVPDMPLIRERFDAKLKRRYVAV